MSLYVRVLCNFYTHRKTARLRVKLGESAYWIPPRLWAYAAETQPDGTFADYTADELAAAIGYTGNPKAMLEALLQAGFLDRDPLRLHDWQEHNGYHTVFAERAKKAAAARWQKERSKERVQDKRGQEPSIASSINRGSMPPAPAMECLANSAPWKLVKDRTELRKQIRELKESSNPDADLLKGLQAELDKVNGEIKRRGKSAPTSDKPRAGRKEPERDSDAKPIGELIASLPRVHELAEQARAEIERECNAARTTTQ